MSEAKIDRKGILEMARGGFLERADYEMTKIIDNILDPNTRADKKRTLTITLDLIPDADRQTIRVNTVVKSKLEPTNPVATSLYISGGVGGDMVVSELVPQVPGQTSFSGDVQEAPPLLRLVK
ncbi:hypothetical protein [Papillibacter cinnamivorans]|uniref:Replication terminator protein n=1 Tax=Papillibacter cinnamivorans DSM 12816 TaxID=1122930 RepID=A0A1W1YPX4_9FIRM|nr:hypothetical protein [Papillibacter cinnamivorans]SMC38194.1 hypothetical protein SAMN02745168_0604 [Papillibacter cinnamivorans DSM 12816]